MASRDGLVRRAAQVAQRRGPPGHDLLLPLAVDAQLVARTRVAVRRATVASIRIRTVAHAIAVRGGAIPVRAVATIAVEGAAVPVRPVAVRVAAVAVRAVAVRIAAVPVPIGVATIAIGAVAVRVATIAVRAVAVRIAAVPVPVGVATIAVRRLAVLGMSGGDCEDGRASEQRRAEDQDSHGSPLFERCEGPL